MATLPAPAAQVLQRAIDAAYKEAVAVLYSVHGSPTPQGTRNAVQLVAEVVQAALKDCSRKHNAAIPRVSRLPIETVNHIFRLLKFQDLVSATHVCERWRTTALACPALWSRVTIDGRTPYVLARVLKRTGSAPVDLLQICIYPSNISDVTRCLRRHISHTRTLVVSFSDIDRDPEDFTQQVLTLQAPLLSSFTLETSGRLYFRARPCLFAGVAPRLVSANINCYAMHLSGETALANLRHLSYACHDFRPPDWSAIFSMCHRLETLHVGVQTFSASTRDDDDGPTSVAGPFAPPSSLTCLSVTSWNDFPAASLLHVTHQDVHDLRITLAGHFPAAKAYALVSALPIAPPESLDLRCTNSEFGLTRQAHFDMRLVDGNARVRRVSGLPFGPLEHFGLGDHKLRHVTRLTIKGIEFASRLNVLHLPALRSLTIAVRHVGLPGMSGEGFLDCPALETACFCRPADDHILALTRAEDICAALRAVLRSRHTLAVLELRGVGVIRYFDGCLADVAKRVEMDIAPVDMAWEGEAARERDEDGESDLE